MRLGRRPEIVFAGLVTLLASCGGGDDAVTPPTPDPPRATTITVSPTTGALGFIGATANFTATVRDQNGSVMTANITWTSTNAAVVSVTGSGQATAVSNGTASITAAVGGISAAAAVTVQQVATQLLIVSGDAQEGSVGETLASPLVVQVSDSGGAGMSGVGVTFAVGGGGALSDDAANSDSQGQASTTWTLGTNVAEAQQVTAVLEGGAGQTVFNASVSTGAPAAFLKVSGDAQLGGRGRDLSAPLVVSVTDAFDNPIEGFDVAFAATGGGGSFATPNVQTDETGRAQTDWTLGAAAGANTATAAAVGFTALQFTATALTIPDLKIASVSFSPAVPTHEQAITFSVVVQNDGDGPNAVDVPVAISVDNVLVGSAPTGTVAPNGGQVTVTIQGGPFGAGGHSLEVEVDPDQELQESDEINNLNQSIFQVIEASVLTDGVPVTNLAGALNSSTFFILDLTGGGGAAVTGAVDYDGPVAASVQRGGGTQKYSPVGYFERPGAMSPSLAAQSVAALQITLSGDATGEDADLYVKFGSQPSTSDFDFRSIGSTNTESLTITNPQSGVWHIMVQGASPFSNVTLTAGVGEAPQPGNDFDIELVFLSSATSAQMDAFESARTRWQAAITGDVPNVNFGTSPVAAGACIEDQPAIVDIVDDLRIFIRLIEIDGAFGTLGQAGPCVTLNTSNLPVLGMMEFDTADLDFLLGQGLLTPVVLHEMGHVLGIGSLWGPGIFNLIVNPSLPSSPGVDTHFTGTSAIAAFDAAGGTAYVGGEKVPVENVAGEGSGDSHWRESVLENELMTPSLDSGSNPLSAISLASLADLGYQVNLNVADSYTLDLGLSAAVEGPKGYRGPVLYFGDDVVRKPIVVVDKNGRVFGVIRHE